MRKTGRSGHGMLHTLLTTLCLGILFGFLFLAYVAFIPWPPNLWILLLFRDVLPIIVSVAGCFAVFGYSFRFRLANLTSKRSICRFVSRILCVPFFLVIGYLADTMYLLSNASAVFDVFGGYEEMIRSLLGNFTLYIFVAAFLFVFALVEYLFATCANNKT